MFITTAMFVGLPEHHRQPGQYRVTCRTPEVCSGWDKGDIPPVEANREECQIIWKGNTPEKAWKEELYMLKKTCVTSNHNWKYQGKIFFSYISVPWKGKK